MASHEGADPRKRLVNYSLVVNAQFHHELSMDNDPHIQEWLRLAHKMEVLGGDIAEASDTTVLNKLTGELALCPDSPCCICSWVCHSVSAAKSAERFEIDQSTARLYS